MNITAADVEQFVLLLEGQFFLENSRSEQATSRKSYGHDSRESLFARLLFIKIKAIDPTKLLTRLLKFYKPFDNRAGYIIQTFLILFGVILFITNASNFSFTFDEIFHFGSLLAIVITFFILVTVHEFAHAMICRKYGGEVREIGFLFLYFQPCCYCDLSEAWMFPEKRKRLAVTLAGPYSELILMALTLIVWRVTIPGSLVSEVARLLIIVIWVTLLFNLNPLIKLDGYYMLSDWLEIPNLRSKSFTYFKNLFQRLILGWPIEKIGTSAKHRRIFIGYALLSLVYTSLLVVYFIYLAAGFLLEKFGLLGLLLLFGFLLYALRLNIYRILKGIVKHIIFLKDIMKKPVRLIIYLVITAAFIILLFFVPFPHRVTGEVVINPIAEYSILLNDFGLLEKKSRKGGADAEQKSSYIQMASLELASLDLIPYVTDGQKVVPGDTLAILVSNQVTREIEAERSTLEKLTSDLALLKSPPKKEEINEAIAEVNAAEAVFNQRLKDVDRIKELFDKDLITKTELETAESLTSIAKAVVENKKAKLNLLKSPPKPEEEAVIQSQIEKQMPSLIF